MPFFFFAMEQNDHWPSYRKYFIRFGMPRAKPKESHKAASMHGQFEDKVELYAGTHRAAGDSATYECTLNG
jgi:hypothetical protein